MAYLTSAQVRDRFKISDATLYRWEHDASLGFPKPLQVKRRKLYDEDKMREWEKTRFMPENPKSE
jgi:predicted DNA-binding transcriptional regulator AlpA